MFARSHLFVKQNNIQWIQFLFYWRRSRRWVPSTSIVSLVVMEFRILCRRKEKKNGCLVSLKIIDDEFVGWALFRCD